ncbi:hypothetical protein PPSIR1_15920 [Plesiocystis pacifica SIR-1]|uniref:Transmembrane protein n=1 Tax=Plesiocystis pacifica SIR-1 TaxID=391625 RepID=A6GAR2_9BACT|nr:DUF924 family protein [Plesiocystis pacifica]EDM77003.1 hypothetical protein PPSIR1_15920 [Plesiocystis pacifica SIR-1]
MSTTSVQPSDVLEFWFPDDPIQADALWWGKSPETDESIRARFGDARERAKAGELDAWAEQPAGRMALIILLDQMSRNLFRGDAETYAADAKAVALCLDGLERGHDQALPFIQRLFFYMPLEHAEDLGQQERCVELVRALADAVRADPGISEAVVQRYDNFVDFAVRHRDIVARFGRFPHRNAILGRDSTAEEAEFLTQPGSSF